MVTLTGRRIKGTGTAASNLIHQIPLILSEFPEIKDCHYGTINLELESPLIVAIPDYRSKPIPWHPAFGAGEIFDFLRIHIEMPPNPATIPAWLYIAHGSPHRLTPHVHEILGPTLPTDGILQYNIHINRKHVTLPYNQCRIFVIL